MTSLRTILQLSQGLVVAALIALAPTGSMAQPSTVDATGEARCGAEDGIQHELAGQRAALAVLESRQRGPRAVLECEEPELEDDEHAPPLDTCALTRFSPEPLPSFAAVDAGVAPSACWVSSPSTPSAHPRGPPIH
jgi:hypothetical protein